MMLNGVKWIHMAPVESFRFDQDCRRNLPATRFFGALESLEVQVGAGFGIHPRMP